MKKLLFFALKGSRKFGDFEIKSEFLRKKQGFLTF